MLRVRHFPSECQESSTSCGKNGGDSLKDQVNAIASCQTEIKAEMGIIKDLLIATVEKPKKTRVRKAS